MGGTKKFKRGGANEGGKLNSCRFFLFSISGEEFLKKISQDRQKFQVLKLIFEFCGLIEE